jgi:hypothetical protein
LRDSKGFPSRQSSSANQLDFERGEDSKDEVSDVTVEAEVVSLDVGDGRVVLVALKCSSEKPLVI